jgi:hypothetical protein
MDQDLIRKNLREVNQNASSIKGTAQYVSMFPVQAPTINEIMLEEFC